MADPNKDRFLDRLEGLEKKAAPGARVVRRMNADGLMVDEVIEKKRRSLIPFKPVIVIVLIVVGVKGYLLADLGDEAYSRQIEEMRAGSPGEIMAAFLLDADPATQAMANLFRSVIR